MANFCETNITFYSLNKNALEKYLETIEEIYNQNPGNKTSGWLGFYQKKFFSQPKKIYNRDDYVSAINELKQKGDYWSFEIGTFTLYEPKIDLWDNILKNHYPEIKFAYLSQDNESLFFIKSDITGLFYPDMYYIDICYPKDNTVVYDNLTVTSKLELYSYLDKVIPFKYDKSKNINDLEEEIWETLETKYNDECFVHLARYIDVDHERII